MNTTIRAALVGLFLLLAIFAKRELAKPSLEDQLDKLSVSLRASGKIADSSGASMDDLKESGLPYQDMSKLFALMVVTALAGGAVLVKVVLPMYRDGLSSTFLDTSHQSAFVKAKILVNEEKYPQAIAALREIAKTTPEEHRAILEIARVQATCLQDTKAALATLRAAFEDRDVKSTQAAIYGFRLVEMYRNELQDFSQARSWAEELMRRFPHSVQAGQASTLLSEMEEAEWKAKQGKA